MDEKRHVLVGASRLKAEKSASMKRNGQFGFAILLMLCALASIARHSWQKTLPHFGNQPHHHLTTSKEFDWESAPSKPYLEYSSCYDGKFQCARLELPMDYWNGTTDATISLAVIRSPAKVKVTHPQYGGSVLLNPGGPGGSGISTVLSLGPNISEMIGSSKPWEGRLFDVMSFDPRGVGATTPGIRCSENPSIGQQWQIRVMEEGVLGSSDTSLGRVWSMAVAGGGTCSLPPKDGSPDIKRYSSTASVARDMVSLVEAHGQWRENEARKLLGIVPGTPRKRIDVPSRLKWKRGEEKIQYWGFSYGSYLGLTFAAMFPDKIERLVVDGVVDPLDYSKSLWYDNLVDTEKDMNQFYSTCATAGFPKCPLANETGETTAEGVKQRAHNITMSLYHNPLPVIGDSPEIIAYSDVKNLVLGSLYTPVRGFPLLANMLSDIEKRNGTRFAELLASYHSPYCPGTSVSIQRPTFDTDLIVPIRNNSVGAKEDLLHMVDALTVIACTDGDSQANMTKADFEKHFRKEIKLSPSIGAMWSTIRMGCAHFSIRAHHRFVGPWEGNTSHPLLLVGNTADPVTPVRNAINAAKGFPGARALVQDSPGHCSASTASRCTTRYVRQYFQTGELPPEGKVCGVDEVPFGPAEAGEVDKEVSKVKESVARLRNALWQAGGFGRGSW